MSCNSHYSSKTKGKFIIYGLGGGGGGLVKSSQFIHHIIQWKTGIFLTYFETKRRLTLDEYLGLDN